MCLPAFSEKYGLPGCEVCIARGGQEAAGCGHPPGTDSVGRPLPPYQVLGMTINERPISYVFGPPDQPKSRRVVAALDLFRDRLAGRHIPLGQAPMWYDEAMQLLDATRREVEWKEHERVLHQHV